MAKKHIILFITTIFFLGISHAGLCRNTNFKITPNCCSSKNPPSADTKDCFLSCAKQRLNTIKIESCYQEDLKTKIPLFLGNKSYYIPQNYLFNFSPFQNLNQINIKLNISHIYFVAVFNHAPPLALN